MGVRFSAPIHTSPGAHPASCTIGIGSLSQGQSSQDVALTTHLYLARRLKKEYSYTFHLPLGFHGRLQGEFYLSLFHFTVKSRTHSL